MSDCLSLRIRTLRNTVAGPTGDAAIQPKSRDVLIRTLDSFHIQATELETEFAFAMNEKRERRAADCARTLGLIKSTEDRMETSWRSISS